MRAWAAESHKNNDLTCSASGLVVLAGVQVERELLWVQAVSREPRVRGGSAEKARPKP